MASAAATGTPALMTSILRISLLPMSAIHSVSVPLLRVTKSDLGWSSAMVSAGPEGEALVVGELRVGGRTTVQAVLVAVATLRVVAGGTGHRLDVAGVDTGRGDGLGGGQGRETRTSHQERRDHSRDTAAGTQPPLL